MRGSDDDNLPFLRNVILSQSFVALYAKYIEDAEIRAEISHNHTYAAMPPEDMHLPRPVPRDPKAPRPPPRKPSQPQRNLTRDEKLAQQHTLPLTNEEITNLPMDEFNERISKFDLTEVQLTTIKDIRRRGKNKVAAQNCRKRKLDQITHLANEVQTVKSRKCRIQEESEYLTESLKTAKEGFCKFYNHIFRHLQDSRGRPMMQCDYRLERTADGKRVVLLPKHKDPSEQNDHHQYHDSHHYHDDHNHQPPPPAPQI